MLLQGSGWTSAWRRQKILTVTTKNRLHKLVDELSEREADDASTDIRDLGAVGGLDLRGATAAHRCRLLLTAENRLSSKESVAHPPFVNEAGWAGGDLSRP